MGEQYWDWDINADIVRIRWRGLRRRIWSNGLILHRPGQRSSPARDDDEVAAVYHGDDHLDDGIRAYNDLYNEAIRS